MGGRLSMPRSPDKTTEISRPTTPPRYPPLNARTLIAPLAAITMAGLLFVYTRTSIRAAKLNAQKHREADGGQISWRNESRRRHGQAEQVEGTIKQAFMGEKPVDSQSSKVPERARSEEEQALDRALRRRE